MIKFVQNLATRETKTFSGYMNTKEFVKWVLAVLCGLLVLVLLVQRPTAWPALLALVVLAAVFLGIRQYNKNTVSATSTTEDTQETVLDVNSDDITSFSYVYEGETYAFEKKDETWYYTDDHSLNLNQDRIKAMILKVAPLKADQVIENVTDMSQYGLADPERTIQYETADRSVIINIGNLNSMTSQYYIAFPSEMKVYVVTTNVVTGFNYTLEDLVEEEDSTDVAEESQEMQ